MRSLSLAGLLLATVPTVLSDDLYPINSLLNPGSALPFGGPFPAARVMHTLALVSDYLAVYGGFGTNGTTLNDINLFHLPSSKWSGPISRKECCNEATEPVDVIGKESDDSIPFLKEGFEGDYPLPRAEHASCGLGDVMYTFGGLTDYFDAPSTPTLLNDLSAFDTQSLSWRMVTTKGGEGVPARRAGHNLHCYSDGSSQKLILFGGRGTDPRAFADLWSFDVDTYSWTRLDKPNVNLAARPLPRQHAGLAMIGLSVYVFGGVHPFSGLVYGDLWKFQTTDQSWHQLHSPANPAFPYQFAPPGLAHVSLFPAMNGQGLLIYGGVGSGGVCADVLVCSAPITALGQSYLFLFDPSEWIAPLVDVNDLDALEAAKVNATAQWVASRLSMGSADGKIIDQSAQSSPLYPGKRTKAYAYEETVLDGARNLLYEFGGAQAVAPSLITADQEVMVKAASTTDFPTLPGLQEVGGSIFAPLSNTNTGESLHTHVPLVVNGPWSAQSIWQGSTKDQVAVMRSLRKFAVSNADIVLVHESKQVEAA